ncbi:MAG: 3'-5' exonuclease [Deltaproteobacteria bacterium]|nr:3'-5' exonuclease [Deltaproteobacteria bacterium]
MVDIYDNDVCGCFPTGRHYPGIADKLAGATSRIPGLSKLVKASERWREAKLAVIDFETTGLEPDNDRVLEAGVACYDNGSLARLKNWLINPAIPVPPESRAVHQISDEQLAQAPFFSEVVAELTEVLRGRLAVAYNADFDRNFLLAELGRLGQDFNREAESTPAFSPDLIWIDPLVWVRELHRDEKSNKLTEVCARMGISVGQAHRAADDAEATGKVLFALEPHLPATYGELIRIQTRYAARQELSLSSKRGRRG